MRLRTAGVATSVAVLALAGCGADRTYSIEEVKQVFREQGYELVPPADTDIPTAPDYLFRPEGLLPFLVSVPTDDEANRAWPVPIPDRSDPLDFRRANVIVIATSRMAARHELGVRAALESLPDRGGTVTVLR